MAVEAGWRSGHQWRLWLSGLIGSRYDGLVHFAIVEPGVLMRSGQPRVSDLEQIRKEHGLGAIVCARGGTRHPLRGRWFRKQRAYCAAHGVHLEHIRMSDSRVNSEDAIGRFLSVVRDPQRRPVLVHCEQGFHRTGLLCAAYRIAECGWTLDQALDEMRVHGFDPADKKRQPLIDQLAAWSQTPAAASAGSAARR